MLAETREHRELVPAAGERLADAEEAHHAPGVHGEREVDGDERSFMRGRRPW